jgi:hypothetical protein
MQTIYFTAAEIVNLAGGHVKDAPTGLATAIERVDRRCGFAVGTNVDFSEFSIVEGACNRPVANRRGPCES